VEISGNPLLGSGISKELPLSGIQVAGTASEWKIGPGNILSEFTSGIWLRNGGERMEIVSNSIFDNEDEGILHGVSANEGMSAASINEVQKLGYTQPCARVNLYTNEADERRLFLGSRYAELDGSFPLVAPVKVPDTMNITTIVTDRYGNSSPFSIPVPVVEVVREDLDTNPEPGFCNGYYQSAADYDASFSVDITELLRLIQLDNSLECACDANSEDGYTPGAGDRSYAARALALRIRISSSRRMLSMGLRRRFFTTR